MSFIPLIYGFVAFIKINVGVLKGPSTNVTIKFLYAKETFPDHTSVSTQN